MIIQSFAMLGDWFMWYLLAREAEKESRKGIIDEIEGENGRFIWG